jgi:hypothetical protein
MVKYIVFALIGAVIGIFLMNTLGSMFGDGVTTIVSLVILAVVGLVIYRNLQTNRKVAEAPPGQRAHALAFAPEPSKAALYIFRNQWIGRAVGVNVLIDGRDVAQIKSPRFTRILLTPGSHRISGFISTNARPADVAGLELVANASEIYIAKCEVEPQMAGAVVKFTPVALEHARADLQKITRMVVPDMGEV